MNGDLQEWVQRIDDKADNLDVRVGKLETNQGSCMKMQDERYDSNKWYMRTTLAAALGTLLTLLVKTIFKI